MKYVTIEYHDGSKDNFYYEQSQDYPSSICFQDVTNSYVNPRQETSYEHVRIQLRYVKSLKYKNVGPDA